MVKQIKTKKELNKFIRNNTENCVICNKRFVPAEKDQHFCGTLCGIELLKKKFQEQEQQFQEAIGSFLVELKKKADYKWCPDGRKTTLKYCAEFEVEDGIKKHFEKWLKKNHAPRDGRTNKKEVDKNA